MSTFAKEGWMPVLSHLNSILLNTDRWRSHLTQEALSTGWCGLPGASENEILDSERRLGIRLPPSYRSFLLISNGWRPFSSFVECLLPVKEIERFRKVDPEDLTMLQECYQEDEISNEDYLDYETPKHIEALRHRYYPECLLIGKGWDGGGGELILLNPQVVSPENEWETIFFANWIPGNRRFRSFHAFILDSVSSLERIEEGRRK